jgi:hypothetical protein
MITSFFRILAVACFTALSSPSLFAADNDVLLNASAITLGKADADLFLSAIGSGTVSKDQMAALLKRGRSTGTLVIRAKSGQRPKAGSKKFGIEADVIVKDGTADIVTAVQEGTPKGELFFKLISSVSIKLGTTQLLGVNDEPGNGPTHLYFLTAQ